MKHNELIKIAYEYLKRNNYDEDLIQDALIKLYTNIDKFDPEKSSIQTFALTIAKRIAIDVWRKDKNNDIRPFTDFERKTYGNDLEDTYNSVTNELHSNDLSPIDKLIVDEEVDNVEKLFQKLPLSQFTIMHLFYIKQLTVEEITAEEQISYENAKTLLSRGRSNLKRIINGHKLSKKYLLINITTNEETEVKTYKEAAGIVGCTVESVRLAYKENRVFKKNFRIILSNN